MKVCLITSLYPPKIIGGAEIVVEKIAEGLIKKGNEIIVITSSEEGIRQESSKIRVYGIPFKYYTTTDFYKQNLMKKLLWHFIDLFNLKPYPKIKNILEKEKPDVVHIHNYKGLSPLAFKAAKDLKIPIVFTVHDYSSICIRRNLLNGKGGICKNPRIPCKIYKELQKYLIQDKPDLVTAPSNFVLKQLESRGLFKNVERIVLPNPIETRKKIKRIEKGYENIDILFVGSLSEHKGPRILINAFKKNRNNNIKLHIVGEGPQEDRLKALASDDNRIQFYGFLAGKELMDMYKMANITAVPSIWYEVFGLVILESFMNSTPVIASRIGGIPELVRDEYNGFLFEPGDDAELANILNRVSGDPEILGKLERGAYESSKKYDIKKYIDKLEGIYRSLT